MFMRLFIHILYTELTMRNFIAPGVHGIIYITIMAPPNEELFKKAFSIALKYKLLYPWFYTVFTQAIPARKTIFTKLYFHKLKLCSISGSRRFSLSGKAGSMKVTNIGYIYKNLTRYDAYRVRELLKWRITAVPDICAIDAAKDVIVVNCTGVDGFFGDSPARKEFKCYENLKLSTEDNLSVLDVIRLDATISTTVHTVSSSSQSVAFNYNSCRGSHDNNRLGLRTIE